MRLGTLVFAGLTICVGIVVQYLFQRRKRAVTVTISFRKSFSKAEQEDEAISQRYGCQPAPRLQNQRPWGVDRLEQIFRADAVTSNGTFSVPFPLNRNFWEPKHTAQ